MQVCDYSLERAVELYFETGGADLSARIPVRPAPPPPPPVRERTPSPQVQEVDVYEEEDLYGQEQAQTNSVDDDEAFARRLMQEEVENSELPESNGMRSPIAARNDILVHPDTDYDDPYQYPSRTSQRARRGGNTS